MIVAPLGGAWAGSSGASFAVRTLIADALTLRGDEAGAEQPEGPPAQAASAARSPALSATLDDALDVDSDADGVADAGDTIGYTAVVSNPGDMDATGAAFEVTLDPGTTLVPGSVDTTPLARPDVYTALGNVPITVPAGSGVLANDNDPDGSGLAGTPISAFDAASANGGTVALTTADGAFTYTPPAGFEGTDTFTYTLADGEGNADTGTVTVTVTGVVWFIDNSGGGAAGSGTLGDPFDTLAAFEAVNGNGGTNPAAGDCVFLYTGTSAYTGGVTLENTQRLVGQGASVSLVDACGLATPTFSATLPATGGAAPTLTNGSGAGVTLAQNNHLRGFTVGTTTGAGLVGTGFGTLTAVGVTVNGTGAVLDLTTGTFATGSAFGTLSTTSVTGTGIDLDAVGGSFTATTTSLTGVTGTGIAIRNAPTLTSFTFGATTVSSTGTGIDLAATNHATSTFTFNLAITTSAGAGLVANAGAVRVTSPTSTISATGGPALDLANVSMGNGSGGAMTFATLASTNSTGHGLEFDNVSGSLTATTSTTVTNPANTGVDVNGGSATYSFGDLDVSTTDRTGLFATNGGTLNSTSGTFSTGIATGLDIDNTALGLTLTSVTSSGGSAPGIDLRSTSGSFTVSGTGSIAGSGGTISVKSGADGSTTSGIGVYLQGASNVTLANMTFSGTFSNFGIRGDTVTNFTLRDSNLSGTFGTSNAADEGVVSFDNLIGTALFEGNTLAGGYEDIIVIENSTGSLNLTVRDSAGDPAVIGLNGTTTGNDGILVTTSGSASLTMLVDEVTFSGSRGDMIQVDARGTSAQNVTIRNNTMHNAHPDIVSGGGGISLGLSIGTGAGPNVTYRVTGNSFRGAEGNVINVSAIGPSGAMSGTILNNTIGNNNGVHNADQANTGSNSGGSGIFARVEKDDGGGTLTNAIRIENNDIGDIANGIGGIHLVANGGVSGNGTARLEATILNNRIDENGVNIAGGIYTDVGGAGGNDGARMGLNIESNLINMTGSNNAIAALVFGDLTNNAQYYFPGYGGPYTDPGLAAFHTGGEGNTLIVSGFVQQVTTAPTGTFATGNPFVLPVPVASLRIPESGDDPAGFYASASVPAGDRVTRSTPQVGGNPIAEVERRELPVRAARSGWHPISGPAQSGPSAPEEDFSLGAPPIRSPRSAPVIPATWVPASASPSAPPAFSGETINLALGTLPAGKSVSITFQATVDDPVPDDVNLFCTQGAATADGGLAELTDDPDTAEADDPTCTIARELVVTIVPLDAPGGNPVADPVNVPAAGAAVPFRATITNQLPGSNMFEVWPGIRFPNGTLVVKNNPMKHTLSGGAVLTIEGTVKMAASFPPGSYEAWGFAGDHPSDPVAMASFSMEKAAALMLRADPPAGYATNGALHTVDEADPEEWLTFEVTGVHAATSDEAEAMKAALMAAAVARLHAHRQGLAARAAAKDDAGEAPVEDRARTDQGTGAPEATAEADHAQAHTTNTVPTTYALHAAYPNPFNPVATLHYDLPEAARVRLSVYDARGREVERLVDLPVEAGRHRVRFDGSSLSSGVYVVRIEAGTYTASRRITLLK